MPDGIVETYKLNYYVNITMKTINLIIYNGIVPYYKYSKDNPPAVIHIQNIFKRYL